MLTTSKLNDVAAAAHEFQSSGRSLPINPGLALELVKMARRYLWLRDDSAWSNLGTPTVISHCPPQASPLVLTGIELDEAIDSAINSQRKKGGEG